LLIYFVGYTKWDEELEKPAEQRGQGKKVKEEEDAQKKVTPKVKPGVKPDVKPDVKPAVKAEEEAEEESSRGTKVSPFERYVAMSRAQREEARRQELLTCEGIAESMKAKRLEGYPREAAVPELVKKITKLDKEIFVAKSLRKDRDEGKETALGTSKTNYIGTLPSLSCPSAFESLTVFVILDPLFSDPRLSFAWAKKYDVKPSKIFPKTVESFFFPFFLPLSLSSQFVFWIGVGLTDHFFFFSKYSYKKSKFVFALFSFKYVQYLLIIFSFFFCG
jgi:hypothetical protein